MMQFLGLVRFKSVFIPAECVEGWSRPLGLHSGIS
jgi:hypothetical protein